MSLVLAAGTIKASRSAGPRRPILISARGTVRQLDDNGAVLGVFPTWKNDDAVVHLVSGDRLLLFTDGITEVASTDDEEFGETRLMDLARSLVKESPAAMKVRLIADVKAFCNSQLEDDVTPVVIAALAQNETAAVATEPSLAVNIWPVIVGS